MISENEFYTLFMDSDISANAKLTLFILLRFKNRKDGKCYPTQDTIAENASLCKNSIRRAIDELIQSQLITIKKERIKGSKFDRTYYYFPFAGSPDASPNALANALANASSPDATKPIEPIEPIIKDIIIGSSNEQPKKDDDVLEKKIWTKQYSQTAPHDDFNIVHKYITDRLPNLKRQSAHEINTWLEKVSANDILRHIDFCLTHSSSPPVSFKYFTPSIMSEATLKKELEEQTERLRKKYE